MNQNRARQLRNLLDKGNPNGLDAQPKPHTGTERLLKRAWERLSARERGALASSGAKIQAWAWSCYMGALTAGETRRWMEAQRRRQPRGDAHPAVPS